MNEIRNNKQNKMEQNNNNKQQQASAIESGKNWEKRRRIDGKMRKKVWREKAIYKQNGNLQSKILQGIRLFFRM